MHVKTKRKTKTNKFQNDSEVAQDKTKTKTQDHQLGGLNVEEGWDFSQLIASRRAKAESPSLISPSQMSRSTSAWGKSLTSAICSNASGSGWDSIYESWAKKK